MEEDKIIEEIFDKDHKDLPEELWKDYHAYRQYTLELMKKALQKGKEIGIEKGKEMVTICNIHKMTRVACQKCYQSDLEFNLKPIEREKDELHSQNSQLVDDMNEQASKITELQEEVKENRELIREFQSDPHKKNIELKKEISELEERLEHHHDCRDCSCTHEIKKQIEKLNGDEK